MLCLTIWGLTTTDRKGGRGSVPALFSYRSKHMATLDFSVIEQAGLTQAEFAKLVNVTRVTVNHWVNGGAPANFLKRVVAGYLDDLRLAIKKEILPQGLVHIPPTAGASEERWEVIDSALIRVSIEGPTN